MTMLGPASLPLGWWIVRSHVTNEVTGSTIENLYRNLRLIA